MRIKQEICFILLGMLILLNIYDVYSTYALLNSGMPVEYEFNPVVRFLIGIFGQFVGITILKVIGLVTVFLVMLSRHCTERVWNILVIGLALAVGCYASVMYSINYPAMLLLRGV